jgi:Septum formation initiator.
MEKRQLKRLTILHESYVNQRQYETLQLKRKRKALGRRLAAFFTLFSILLCILFATLHSQGKILDDKKAELETVQKQYDDLKEKQQELKDEIRKLEDKEYSGKYVRQEYFLSDDGEIIFSVPKDDVD